MLERTGHTEASIDLARLAGLIPAGVICEIMNEDGTMARVPDLIPYCERHDLKMVTVADLIAYRRRTEKLVERIVATKLPTEVRRVHRRRLPLAGRRQAPRGDGQGRGLGRRGRARPRPLRVPHRRRLPLAALRLRRAARGGAGDDRARGRGVLLYLSQEGRGIGLLNKLRAYKLQEDGLDTVDANLELGLPADLRDYGIGAQILGDLGLTSIRILTNNPKKIIGLEGYGLSVTEQVPIRSVPNPHNEAYLDAKRDKLGHTLHHQGLPLDEEMLHDEQREGRRARRRRGRATPATTRPATDATAEAGRCARRRARDAARSWSSRSASRPSTRTSPSGC